MCLVRWGSLPHSSRCGRHQAERDGAEQRSLRTAGRQLDADARDVLDHTRTDLDQALAERRELGLGQRVCLRDGSAQCINQNAAVCRTSRT